MKAITLIQPWATLVVHGFKHFETRSWETCHRGELLIHAGKKRNPAIDDLCTQEPFKSCLARAGYHSSDDLPRGAIIGRVNLLACHKVEDIHPDDLSEIERAFGDYRTGRYAWQLDIPSRLDVPIDFRGALTIFEVPDVLLEKAHVVRSDGTE
jgi:hypothetical protein